MLLIHALRCYFREHANALIIIIIAPILSWIDNYLKVN